MSNVPEEIETILVEYALAARELIDSGVYWDKDKKPQKGAQLTIDTRKKIEELFEEQSK